MHKSSKILAAAALVGFGAMLAGMTVVSDGSARAVEAAPSDVAAERIAAAFAMAPAGAEAPAVGAVRKGDLFVATGCAGQQWPDVPASCLVTAHGVPAHPVRSITIGSQAGEATTILMRLPAPQVASR